jgi:uncharacterized protein
MNSRVLGRSKIKVSEVGLGCEHLEGMSEPDVKAVIDAAIASQINIFDVFMPEPHVRTYIGRALAGRRDQVVLQGHIGAAWQDGQYCRTRDIGLCRTYFQDLLDRLQTDVIDIGMIHFVDSEEDFRSVFDSEVIRYALELKDAGIIKAIGLSSHNPVVALKAVRTGLIDVLMFSINPAYDILPEDTPIDDLFTAGAYQNEHLAGTNPIRAELYEVCAMLDVGITVMKGLGAGTLLRAAASPFGEALTPVQCIHYALNRPAVASVLIGCRSEAEVRQAVQYETASEAERDYSLVLSRTAKYSLRGQCMYCNHCLPCPAKIDIAQVNKYLDLALVSLPHGESPAISRTAIPGTVRAHYQALDNQASACIACGSCEERCPFGVPVINRMRQAADIFGT